LGLEIKTLLISSFGGKAKLEFIGDEPIFLVIERITALRNTFILFKKLIFYKSFVCVLR
jgi:ribosomal protein S15P/S13E